MSKVLFINGNVHGHINPTLPVVGELVKKGEEVYYFSTGQFEKKIKSAGAEFIDYGDEFSLLIRQFKPSGSHPFYTLLEYALKQDIITIPIILEKIKRIKFDYIIHDSILGGGSVLSKKLKVPAVCSSTSFAMNKLPMPSYMFDKGYHPQLDNVYEELNKAEKSWGTGSVCLMDLFFKKEALNIVFTSKMFQPDFKSFDNSFKFIGPSISDREEILDFKFDDNKKQKTIYISMGTINNKCLDFYIKCIDSFKGENLRVIMSIGYKTDVSLLGKIPDNFIVRKYVPQLEVLKRTDVLISHGGLNSVSEALYYGVPVIALPINNDQPMVAGQLVKLGAGIGLKMNEVTSKILKETVKEILSNDKYKKCSLKIRKSFIEAGGFKKAADIIFDYKNKVL